MIHAYLFSSEREIQFDYEKSKLDKLDKSRSFPAQVMVLLLSNGVSRVDCNQLNFY